jgi:hypothetical protein
MVRSGCLPLGKHGVRVLDVGTGPGPAALAVADFYRSLGEFAQAANVPGFQQSTDVSCIEASPSVNSFRHHLVEFLNDHVQLGGALLPDFASFDPPGDRRAHRFQLLSEGYYDEVSGYEEPLYSPSQLMMRHSLCTATAC